MYKIIGGDQKEYGPVSFDQLVAWIRDNRANGQTVVQKDAGPWVPLSSLPEFASILSGGAAVPPLNTPSMGPQPQGSPLGTGASSYPPGGPVYASSPGFGGTGGVDVAAATAAVQGPATALLVTAVLGVIAVLLGAVVAMVGMNAQTNTGDMPPEMRQIMESIKAMQTPALVAIETVIKLAVAGVILIGALKLRKLESFPLVVTAAILAIVPCTSPCCCVGLPVGIWVLVAVFKPHVKSAFR